MRRREEWTSEGVQEEDRLEEEDTFKFSVMLGDGGTSVTTLKNKVNVNLK